MARLAESLIHTYFYRLGFFVIPRWRLPKNRKIDLLAVSIQESAQPQPVQAAIQVSRRPVSYLGNNNARRRTDDQVRADMESWFERKFGGSDHQAAREKLIPGGDWKYWFIHGVIKDERELNFLSVKGVRLVEYREVVEQVCREPDPNDPSTVDGVEFGDLLNTAREITR